MAEIEIRPAISNDIAILEEFDHSCETTHVWQLESSVARDHVIFDLREVKLPRVLRLNYLERTGNLKDTWTKHTLFLVAISEGKPVGYLILDDQPELESTAVKDIVVDLPMRQQGIASSLILASQQWLKKRGTTRLVIEVPAKNHPMIQLARKLRFEFSGLADNHYSNGDIAFFFINKLK